MKVKNIFLRLTSSFRCSKVKGDSPILATVSKINKVRNQI